jgi:glyoxylase-like metal-dependent hydrolase (beta-lactamase superfamily II)
MSSGWSVLAVRYGTLQTTRSDAYYRYQAYGEPDGPQRLDYFFWIVRRGDETILVDTGFDPEVGRRRGRTCLIEPAEAMAQLGVSADTVSRVVLTHLHYDHTGNLGRFPDAQLLVSARELDFWLGPLARRAQFAHAVEATELGQVLAAVDAGRVRRLEGGEEIADGVHAVLLGGHSPGQIALGIDGRAGWIVLASDAMHFYEELERDRPFGVLADLAGMYEAYDTLRELSGAPHAQLVPGHDAAVMARYPRVEGPAGEFAVEIR